MGIIMDFFHARAYFITSALLISMLCMVIISREFSQRNIRWVNQVLNIFMLANLALIFVMTVTPVGPHVPTPEEIYWATQPRPPFFPNGWRWNSAWHDTGANIMLMMPLAVALCLKTKPLKALLSIMCLSSSIEIFQHFYGHGRTSQMSDFLNNSLGGVIGVGIAMVGILIHKKFDPTIRAKTLNK